MRVLYDGKAGGADETRRLEMADAAFVNEFEAWIEFNKDEAAGRACERFPSLAAAMDIRTALLNRPIDVKGMRDRFPPELGLKDRRPELTIYFGRGARLLTWLRLSLSAMLAG